MVKRRDVTLTDPQGLIDHTVTQVRAIWDGDPLRLLRTYWYDGARDGVPSNSQVRVGGLPRVKLRLGRVSGGGQKGVDGLIILDLINLARNRAADVAVIISGDEDLREAAAYAQGFGVTVVVAGFPETPRQGQSILLLREADQVITFEPEEIKGFLEIREQRDQVLEAGDTASEALPPEEAEDNLRQLCIDLINDPRFACESPFEPGSGGSRLTKRADRVLVARLAEMTGTFPVEADVLRRARATCRELARTRRDADSGPSAGAPGDNPLSERN